MLSGWKGGIPRKSEGTEARECYEQWTMARTCAGQGDQCDLIGHKPQKKALVRKTWRGPEQGAHEHGVFGSLGRTGQRTTSQDQLFQSRCELVRAGPSPEKGTMQESITGHRYQTPLGREAAKVSPQEGATLPEPLG